jgi:Putative endonuclease, protein of unknown function (DUF1780)
VPTANATWWSSFFRCLGLPVTPDELRFPPQDDDVDVCVRGACFQITELLDPERHRHAEVKARHEQVQRARRAADLETPRAPESVPCPWSELTTMVVAALRQTKQARLVNRAHLDALVLVSLRDRQPLVPVPTVLDDVTAVEALGWRSISALWPTLAIVFCAAATAPAFLREHAGRVVWHEGGSWKRGQP